MTKTHHSDSQELKGFQTQKTKLEAELKVIENEERLVIEKKKLIKNKIKELNKKIDDLKNNSSEIIVSEHALLRYVEIKLGIDLEQVKKEILTEKVLEFIKTLGNVTIPTEDFKIKVRDRTIVTLLKKD